MAEQHLATEAADFFGRRLPHLARTKPWVLEAVDEGLDRFRTFLQLRRVQDRLGEAQALDALRRPLGTDLRAGDAPDFFRVCLEEDLEEPLPESIRDPLLEVLLDRVRLEVPADVAGDAEERVPEA